MAYSILRNDMEYGSYDIAAIKQYVDAGKILKHDKAKDVSTCYVNTVGYFLKTNGIKRHIKSKGSFVDHLRGIGSQRILPIGLLKSRQGKYDKRLLLLTLIGLCLSIIILVPIDGFLVCYAVVLYFSATGGLFFFYFFRTNQVSNYLSISFIAVFLLTTYLRQVQSYQSKLIQKRA